MRNSIHTEKISSKQCNALCGHTRCPRSKVINRFWLDLRRFSLRTQISSCLCIFALCFLQFYFMVGRAQPFRTAFCLSCEPPLQRSVDRNYCNCPLISKICRHTTLGQDIGGKKIDLDALGPRPLAGFLDCSWCLQVLRKG